MEMMRPSIQRGLLAFSLVAVAFASLPAAAQIPADESFRLVRKEYAKDDSCNDYSCDLVFSFIPAKRRFEILNVSCSLSVYADANLYATRLYIKDGAGTIVSVDGLVPVEVGTLTSNARDYELNHSVFIPVGPSQRPVIHFQSDTNWINNVYCSLGGYFVVLK